VVTPTIFTTTFSLSALRLLAVQHLPARGLPGTIGSPERRSWWLVAAGGAGGSWSPGGSGQKHCSPVKM